MQPRSSFGLKITVHGECFTASESNAVSIKSKTSPLLEHCTAKTYPSDWINLVARNLAYFAKILDWSGRKFLSWILGSSNIAVIHRRHKTRNEIRRKRMNFIPRVFCSRNLSLIIPFLTIVAVTRSWPVVRSLWWISHRSSVQQVPAKFSTRNELELLYNEKVRSKQVLLAFSCILHKEYCLFIPISSTPIQLELIL